jgi:hypothetical protein
LNQGEKGNENDATTQLRNQFVGMVDQYISLTTKMNLKLMSDIENYQRKVNKLQGKIEEQSITKDKDK